MTTTNAKMTKVSAFTIALDCIDRNYSGEDKAAVMEKISKEIENLQKKNSGSGKPTKVQMENAAIASELVNWMEKGKPYTITDLSKNCPAVLGMNPQKIRPLLTNLIQAKAVERTEGKGGKPIFTKVEEGEE